MLIHYMKKLLPLLPLLLASTFLNAQRAAGLHPNASHVSKATDTTWLPGWMLHEDFRISSGVWDSSYFHLYQYTGDGFLAVDSNNTYALAAWHPINKYVKEVDSVGQVLRTDYLTWSVSAWEPNHRVESVYDTRGNRILTRQLNWSTSMASWDTLSQSRSTYTYDGLDSLIAKVTDTWTFGVWKPSERYTYTRDALGLVSSMTYASWTGATWQDNVRYDWTYGPTGEVLEKWEYYNSGAGGWTPLRHYYDYTWHNFAKGQYLTRTQADWMGAAYEEVERHTYTYDSLDGHVLVLETKDSAGLWANYEKEEVRLDATGRNTLLEESSWSGTGWVLQAGFKNFYTYGAGGELLVHEQHHLLATGYFPERRYTYGNYSVDAPAPAASSSLTVWPNPAHDKVQITLPEGRWSVQLFNLQGAEVTPPLPDQQGQVELTLRGLRSGIYLLRAEQGGKTITRKVMVR
jgi:hypothetical protein